jgi:hypothetical protein
VGSGGADGNFHGRGSGCGDFPDVGDSGSADGSVGDARNVSVDGGRGTDCAGASCECGEEVGDGTGESFEWADEFEDEVRRRQGGTEKRKAFNAEARRTQKKEEEEEEDQTVWICR